MRPAVKIFIVIRWQAHSKLTQFDRAPAPDPGPQPAFPHAGLRTSIARPRDKRTGLAQVYLKLSKSITRSPPFTCTLCRVPAPLSQLTQTHIARPRDKKTGHIDTYPETSVDCVVSMHETTNDTLARPISARQLSITKVHTC